MQVVTESCRREASGYPATHCCSSLVVAVIITIRDHSVTLSSWQDGGAGGMDGFIPMCRLQVDLLLAWLHSWGLLTELYVSWLLLSLSPWRSMTMAIKQIVLCPLEITSMCLSSVWMHIYIIYSLVVRCLITCLFTCPCLPSCFLHVCPAFSSPV